MLDPLGSCVQGVTGKLCLPKCMWEFKQAPGYLVYSRLLQTMFGSGVRVLGGLVFVGTKSLFSIVAAEPQR